MRYPTSSSRYWKVAARAIAAHLSGMTQPVLMFSLTGVADSAAGAAGRRSDLFPSLFDYVDLLPGAWTTAWLGKGGSGDSLYYAIPKGWRSGEVQRSLTATLMGAREVHIVSSPDA
jgi:hypothetical protein